MLGFSEWGWPGYFCSEDDTFGNWCTPTSCTTSPDCANHNRLPMDEWYLRKFAALEKQTGVRHLDYFDLHYYAQGGSTPAITRSLWDPAYVDPSSINDKIALILRMKCWINGHVAGLCPRLAGSYPKTKMALQRIQPLRLRGQRGHERDHSGRHARDLLAARASISPLAVRSVVVTEHPEGVLDLISVVGHRPYTVIVLNKTSSALTTPLKLTGIAARSPVQT